jgi:hypothetical protein
MPTAEDFRRELFQMMANAQKNGRESIEISARELRARVGPPLRRTRMPNCCRVMKAQLAPDYGDVIVNEPPSGRGPTLTIRYRLAPGEGGPLEEVSLVIVEFRAAWQPSRK